jgi:hypothetical protein
MIRISSLPQIENLEQFKLCTQILLVDVLYVGDAPRAMREYIKANHGGFVFEKKTYLPITLTGQPESLIANAEKGIHFKFDRGFENLYTLSSDLSYTIRRRNCMIFRASPGKFRLYPKWISSLSDIWQVIRNQNPLLNTNRIHSPVSRYLRLV